MSEDDQIYNLNKEAWNRAASDGRNPYTQTVTAEQVAEARQGRWDIYLSDIRPVPRDWFPPLPGLRLLCLASGGGQQGPILAAAGAKVTVLDASPQQLIQDDHVARRDNLSIELVEGDMADLSIFPDQSFDLIINPPSTMFIPDLTPVWRECGRVLQPGGQLITGFMNPDEFIFDVDALDNEGHLIVKHPLPYREHETLTPPAIAQRIQDQEMFHFSHTMESQLGGLIQAGFAITGFYEDRRPEADGNPIHHYLPSYFIARARKQ